MSTLNSNGIKGNGHGGRPESGGPESGGVPGGAKEQVGAVVVCGAGITGIQASLDLAESGFKVYLTDPSPAIGGRMAGLDKTFPTGDCSMCILSPKLVECARNKNIEIITMAEVQDISGDPGNFKVRLKQSPRFVDAVKCNACGDCVEACPVELPNEFDRRLGNRKAIFRPYPQAIPNVFGISKREGRAPCKAACPSGVNAVGYVALIGAGKFKEAYDLVTETCPFPAVCGRVCPHPCETVCSRGMVDEPISISALKRAAVDHGAPTELPEKLPVLHEDKVAIIGGGPAGMSCARDLAQYGYETTVFEALPVAGGMLRVGIPDHRMPQDVLQREIDQICALGVDLRLNQRCGTDFTVDGLFDQGYKAVFLAPGLQTSAPAPVKGDDLEGCVPAVEFLRELNLGHPLPIGDRVVVIGGGDVAFDSARAALRLTSINGKAPEATIAYRRTREEMPATIEEIEEGLAEGVRIEFLATPVEILGSGGKVTAVRFQRNRLGEPDEKGRRRPEPIPDAFFEVPCDTVVFAVGQAIVDDFASGADGIAIDRGAVCTNETLVTARPGVFAGGDAAPQGPLTAINAIAAGRKAAASIHNYLRGKQLVPLEMEPKEEARPTEDELAVIEKAPRLSPAEQPGVERRRNWTEVHETFTREDAIAEAQRCLDCGLCSECMQCVKACGPGAIYHEQRDEEIILDAGSVILTPGFEEFQGALRGEFGHGRYANVLSSVQFERMLSASGPTAGEVLRPSDGGEVKRIAFIQCVGSRDTGRDRGYCSSICCMSATKEAMVALEHAHGKGLEVSIFCMDVRAFGKEFDAYVNRARDEAGVTYIRAIPSRVVEMPGSRTPRVRYFDEEGAEQQEDYDLVVLSVGLQVPQSVREMAGRMGLDLNRFGFADTDRLAPLTTNMPGLYVAGAFQEPKDIPESVAQASAAAACAMEQLAPARGSLVTRREYPWERDVTDEAPRVGVFVCHCGHNIASVIDVEEVAKRATGLQDVAYAETSLYTCSDNSLQHIKDMIQKHKLNRLVVASCSPRTHEAIFQETLRDSGLNQYLFSMANIRDQGSWVHKDDPGAATDKAEDLMSMAVARARHLRALQTGQLPVTASALIIGGGLAGMTAALGIADQGFPVYLIEKEAELGGRLRDMHSTLEGADVAEYLSGLVAKVEAHPEITVYGSSTPVGITGHIGNFHTTIRTSDQEIMLTHGVLIVATGGRERETAAYLHGENPHVVTQSTLEAALAGDKLPAELEGKKNPTVVMIQCVESRNDEHPYCSRVCCSEAIKNALDLKRRIPSANVVILGRDIRTYGFRELYYQQAREAGVMFVRHPEKGDPVVVDEGGALKVTVHDLTGHRDLMIRPDLLVLSTGIAPADGNPVLSGLLRSALTSDGFFLEAHPKLRPVDLANEGEFLAGVAHSPRFIDETIAHALAAVGRATTVLSKPYLEIPGQVAQVDSAECVGCATCVKVCPYGAPMINELGKAEIQQAKCMGCGICVASCPARTITLLHQEDQAVVAMLDELLIPGVGV